MSNVGVLGVQIRQLIELAFALLRREAAGDEPTDTDGDRADDVGWIGHR